METALHNSFEDAEELTVGGSASAAIGAFGFDASGSHATHMVYRLQATAKVARVDTVRYGTCCSEARTQGQSCGIGFVSALIRGNGEYAVARETQASGSAQIILASANGNLRLQTLQRRKVHGYVAALIRTDDPSKLSAFGLKVEELGSKEMSAPEIVRRAFAAEHIEVEATGPRQWRFRDGSGEVITENEFIRRYGARMGPSNVDSFEARRNEAATWIACGGGAALSIGLGAGAYFVADSAETSSAREGYRFRRPAVGWVAAGITGAIVLAGAAPFCISALRSGDGEPEDHYLTEMDARSYARMYNRKLLSDLVSNARKAGARSNALTTIHVGVSYEFPGIEIGGRF